MARIARIALARYPYYITQQGLRRNGIFSSEEDKRLYCELLEQYSREFHLNIWAYSLVESQVHILAYAQRADSLAKAIGQTHMRYANLVNRDRRQTGHFWADRFHSTLLDRGFLWTAVHFIETEPARQGLTKKPEQYKWSSARPHALNKPDPLLAENSPFPDFDRVGKWSKWLAQPPDEEKENILLCNVKTGRPSGSRPFIARIEKRLGLSFSPRKRGPKPKIAEQI